MMIPTTMLLRSWQVLTITALLGFVGAANSNETVSYAAGSTHRGTFNILYSCLAALFGSVWSVLHLNIPAKHDGPWVVFFRKMKWMMIMIIAPELVFTFALFERKAAHSSLALMKNAGRGEWSIVHGFFANQGGFVIEYGTARNLVPLDTSQLLVISESRHDILIPKITVNDINDKSKLDLFAKGFACIQSFWLVITVVARGIQGLAVSQLEIMTISSIFMAVITYGVWWHKPYSVGVPIIIHTYPGQTFPSDLWDELRGVGKEDWDLQVDGQRIQNNKHNKLLPDPRVETVRYRILQYLQLNATFIAGFIFLALHMAAWNFDYPSVVELWLWRGCLIGALISLFLMSLVFSLQRAYPHLGDAIIFYLCLIILIIIYSSARVYLIVEAFISLRSTPSSLYQTNSWLNIFPHI